MAETMHQIGDLSVDCLTSSSPLSACQDPSIGISDELNKNRITLNPPDFKYNQDTVYQDLSPNKHSYRNITHIDTAAPFKSVKAAVNLFGGNAGWKALRPLIKEKCGNYEQELTKAEQDVLLCLTQLEDNENAKAKTLQELEIVKNEVEQLKLRLEKAIIEETQAQHDFELAQLRVNELEKGVSTEDSMALKEEIKLFTSRYLEADNELKSAVFELQDLKKENEKLQEEKFIAVLEAEKASLASKEVDITFERLTFELFTLKEIFHSFERQLSLENDLKIKLNTSTTLLTSLKLELAAYAETRLIIDGKESHRLIKTDNVESLITANKELEEVKIIIQRKNDDVKCLSKSIHLLKCELCKNHTDTVQEEVVIPLEVYLVLMKKANEAEWLANDRVVAAVEKIKDAKKTESLTREKLETSYVVIKEKKEELKKATEKADKANEGKLIAEQELRDWRAENEQRRKNNETPASSKNKVKNSRYYTMSFDDDKDANRLNQASVAVRMNSTPILNRQYSANSSVSRRSSRKKSFFPRIVLFFTKKTTK